MDDHAYTLNLGYSGPSVEVASALALTADDLPAALRMVATTLDAAAQRCRDAALLAEEHSLCPEEGSTVTSEKEVASPLLRELPAYISPRRLRGVIDLVAREHESLEQRSQVEPVVAPVTASILSDAFSKLERSFGDGNSLCVRFLVMNAREYADLRKFGRDVLDVETQAARLRVGIMGCLWGAHVLVAKVPAGKTFLLVDGTEDGAVPEGGCLVLDVTR